MFSFPDGAAPGSRGQSVPGSWGRGWHESIWGDGSEGLDKGVPGPHFACDGPPCALPESTVSISFTPPTVLWLPGKHKSHAAEETWHPPRPQTAAAGNVPLLYLSSELSTQLEFQLIWGLPALLTQPSVLMFLRPWRVNSYQAMAALF